MCLNADEDLIGFSNIDFGFTRLIGIISDKEIDACSPGFFTTENISHSRSRSSQNMTSPVDDFRSKNTGRHTIYEEKPDSSPLRLHRSLNLQFLLLLHEGVGEAEGFVQGVDAEV